MPLRPIGPMLRRSHSQRICAIRAIRVKIFGRQSRTGASAPALGAIGLKHGVSAEPGDRIHCFAHWRTVGRSRGQTRLFYFSALDPTAPRSGGFGLCVPAGLCVFPLWRPPAPPARVPGSCAIISHGEHGYNGFPTDAAAPLWFYTAPEPHPMYLCHPCYPCENPRAKKPRRSLRARLGCDGFETRSLG